jgi:hypothetical protein
MFHRIELFKPLTQLGRWHFHPLDLQSLLDVLNHFLFSAQQRFQLFSGAKLQGDFSVRFLKFLELPFAVFCDVQRLGPKGILYASYSVNPILDPRGREIKKIWPP